MKRFSQQKRRISQHAAQTRVQKEENEKKIPFTFFMSL